MRSAGSFGFPAGVLRRIDRVAKNRPHGKAVELVRLRPRNTGRRTENEDEDEDGEEEDKGDVVVSKAASFTIGLLAS